MKENIRLEVMKVFDQNSDVDTVVNNILNIIDENSVCENCGEGKPTICNNCYEIETKFRESY